MHFQVMDLRHGKGLIPLDLPDENFIYGKKSQVSIPIKHVLSNPLNCSYDKTLTIDLSIY